MGLVCAELHGSTFNSMAARSNFTDQDVAELILVAASDAHSTEDEDISVQTDSETDGTTNACFTQWTDNTNCPTVPVAHKFTAGCSGLRQTEAPNIKKDFPNKHYHARLF